MLERRRAVAWAALLLGLLGWLVWLPSLLPERRLPERVDAGDGALALLSGETLDLNLASAASLEVLPGIGPARARAILEQRARQPFGRVEDLAAVPGVGPRTIAGLEGWVHVAALPPGG
jgi:DNA uptake protein ComE-like DNA-binding protein